MRRGTAATVLLLAVGLLSRPDLGAPLGGAPAPKMRGVCWEGAGRIDPRQLDPLRELGVDWISQTPFGWMRTTDSPEIRFGSSRVLWGESDEGLASTAAWARERGIRTLLKPHLWVHHAWPGDIAMHTENDWKRWFEQYERFILHYARLAERHGLEALAVGTELGGTTGREREWRAIVARVRGVYHGRLTYCANWHEEPERIAFWDALDFIGIQAYYPLVEEPAPAPAAIRRAWEPIAAALAELASRTGRAVVFTEIGYRSQDGALARPWEWDTAGAVNLALQQQAYSAMLDALWDRPWFGGTFVWKWHPEPPGDATTSRDFTPQGKPALESIRAVYRAADAQR